jgi:hypothetical protein
MRKIKISIMYELLVVFGLICIGSGIFIHKKEGKKKGGYVRLHSDEDVKEYRNKLSEDSTEEKEESGGYTNLFSNVLGKEENEYEEKVKRLREKKKKRGWSPMGLFGS